MKKLELFSEKHLITKTKVIPFKTFIKLSFVSLIILTSCSQPEEDKTPNEPQPVNSDKYIITDNQSKLVSNLNGFRFDGGFGTKEPVAYPYLWLQYIDDYKDSTRVVVLNQDSFTSMTKHFVANIRDGKTSRYFDHGTFPNNVSNKATLRFNHPSFILNMIDRTNYTFSETGVVFGMKTQVHRPLTWLNSYKYELIDKYIIRYISGISLWPQLASSGSDEAQFIATSELSDPKAVGHYIDENFTNFPHDIKTNMYSGFFQSTNEKTYIGFAKGGENLATLTLNSNPPTWYNAQICKAFLDKVGETLYLGVLINVPNTAIIKSSLYKMDLATKSIVALYTDKDFNYSNPVFKKGNFYVVDGSKHSKINTTGTIEPINIPESSLGVQIYYGRSKIFAVITDTSARRLEVYSKAL